MTDLRNRTILITGAASGIGLAVARACAAGGARLILVDRDADALSTTAIDAGEVTRATGDVADPIFWRSLDLPMLDHAVVNAGVAGAGPIADLPFAEWRRILCVNLDGAFLTLQAALRTIRDGGSIVAVASAAGLKAEAGVAAYGASKAGMIQLAKVAAKEGAARGVRINAVAPGGVDTPVWDAVPMFAERVAAIGRDAALAEIAALATPLKRFAHADDIAGQILFLLSDAAATITGATLVSDGGYTL